MSEEQELPKDFDWRVYLEINHDLRAAGFITEEEVVRHYQQHGRAENRKWRHRGQKVCSNELAEATIEKIKATVEVRPISFKTGEVDHSAGRVLFTIATASHLAQAKTLGDSLIEHNPKWRFIIFLIGKVPPLLEGVCLAHEVINVSRLGVPNLQELYQKYNSFELAMALKPYCFTYLLESRASVHDLVYADSDILIFNRFTHLESLFEEHDILLTPHIFSPIWDESRPTEQDILNSGIYNLGFIALRRSQNSLLFLKWWALRLQEFCRVDLCNGLFVDQIWINHVPIFFKRVGIIEHRGYNMAYWNLQERWLDAENRVNGRDELVFWHYSGYRFDSIVSVHSNRWRFCDRPDIFSIFCKYLELVFANGHGLLTGIETELESLPQDDGLNISGFVNGSFGVGRYCKSVQASIERLSINHNVNEIFSSDHNWEKRVATAKHSYYNTNLLIFNPDDSPIEQLDPAYLQDKYNIGIWFWELSTIPKEWSKNAHLYSEIWVPSTFMFDVFKANLPTRIKITRVNFPITEPKKMDKSWAKEQFGIAPDEFLCLFIFDYFSDVERKNPYAVVETFKRTFTSGERARLIIKSHNGNAQQLEEMKKRIGEDARITFIHESFKEDRVAVLLNASDVYVSLHRSEGFGLTLMESILLAKPTLCTNYSGNVDFCLPEWSELVDFKLVDVGPNSLYVDLVKESSFRVWAEPDLEDASNKLYKIYQNLAKYEEAAQAGREWILKKYRIENFKEALKTRK